ncbi:MAG TPA: carboxymuconolactone decarboxylase family protein [Chloroflexota bacterium]|nr:carboxymuconolactone decarboxylase family protein [Chloroflexota bacterium]
MARLPALSRDDLDANGQALWDSLIASRGYVGGPTLCIMQHPELAAKSTPLGSELRYNGVLAGADRELTILTAGREVEAVYEWHAHEPIGREVGVSNEAIEVLRNQQPTASLGEREALIIDVVRSLYREHKLSDDLYARAEKMLGRKALVEMIVLAGYYGLIGFVLNAFEVDLPEGATPAFER